eukprot:5448789-Pyramimonas_sp.AAC.2
MARRLLQAAAAWCIYAVYTREGGESHRRSVVHRKHLPRSVGIVRGSRPAPHVRGVTRAPRSQQGGVCGPGACRVPWTCATALCSVTKRP